MQFKIQNIYRPTDGVRFKIGDHVVVDLDPTNHDIITEFFMDESNNIRCKGERWMTETLIDRVDHYEGNPITLRPE